MDRDFWLERWARNEIGFHQAQPHAALARHWPSLGLERGARVFVPLAGKSLDLLWLAAQGHPVVGVELAERAVRAFFEEAGLEAEHEPAGRLTRYRSSGIELLCGDVFDLDRGTLGEVAGVFDRAALVALPAAMRADYAAHLARLADPGTRTLLVTFEYEQARMSGPPFSVSETEVQALYGAQHRIELRERREPEDAARFAARGAARVTEAVYALERC